MKREKKWGQTYIHTDDTHPGANYSRRRNLFRRRQKMRFLTILAAAAASMQQYAAVQYSNSENSPELLLLPQITPIYQISCLFMHAVPIY